MTRSEIIKERAKRLVRKDRERRLTCVMEGVIEIKVTEGQRERAKKLYDFQVLNNSVTEGEGNGVGALGEIITQDYFNAEYVGCYDYDLIIDGKKIDVKSKKQHMAPATHHSCNVFAFNTTQMCDYYYFVFIHVSFEYGWIIGSKQKDKFFEEAIFRKKGEIDDTLNTDWSFTEDCYTMKIIELDKLENEENKTAIKRTN